jgi:hypothetical protein
MKYDSKTQLLSFAKFELKMTSPFNLSYLLQIFSQFLDFFIVYGVLTWCGQIWKCFSHPRPLNTSGLEDVVSVTLNGMKASVRGRGWPGSLSSA